MQEMMRSMGDINPDMMKQAMQQMQGMPPEEFARASEQMKGMDPADIARQAAQVRQQLSSQQQYILNVRGRRNSMHAGGSFTGVFPPLASSTSRPGLDPLSSPVPPPPIHTPQAGNIR